MKLEEITKEITLKELELNGFTFTRRLHSDFEVYSNREICLVIRENYIGDKYSVFTKFYKNE